MPSTPRAALPNILAWWDVDLQIGAYHQRKVTARPLKALERKLGHRLHVEDREPRYSAGQGVWNFEAFNYIDTAEPALASHAMLRLLCTLTDWVHLSWQGLNTAATTLSDDPDERAICAFYWRPPGLRDMPRYLSGGVLLQAWDSKLEPLDLRERRNRVARPVVRLPPVPDLRADFVIEFTVHIFYGDAQALMEQHWPRFAAAQWPDGIARFEVDAQSHRGRPNVIRVTKILRAIREHDAIAYCLLHAAGFRVSLHGGADFRFVGERPLVPGHPDGIIAFVMTRYTD